MKWKKRKETAFLSKTWSKFQGYKDLEAGMQLYHPNSSFVVYLQEMSFSLLTLKGTKK